MKRILLAFLLLSLLLPLASCGLLGGLIPEETTGAETTAPTTTARPPDSTPLPTLPALAAAMKSATPTRSEATVLSVYESPAVTLSAELLFLHTEERDRYEYRIDYLLPMEEALAAGSPIGERVGYLTLTASTVTASSPEVNAEVLEEIRTLSLRMPTFEGSFFTRYEIKKEGSALLLTGHVKDTAVPLLFDSRTEGITDLSVAVTFEKESLLPTEAAFTFTAADGARTTYRAVYSYAPVTIPEG